ncbi:MAG: 30S ribosome-binding factor RbfA [Bacteroidota bacterium]
MSAFCTFAVKVTLQSYMSESNVQKKLAKLIKVELSEILSRDLKYVAGTFITLTLVKVTGDLSLAKVYLSVLPDPKLQEVVTALNENDWEVRKALAGRIKNKVKKIPELRFYEDDSNQYAERIDELLNDL